VEYLVAAYGIVIAALLGYVVRLSVVEASCQRQTEILRQTLANH
jgi:hypothetical protein